MANWNDMPMEIKMMIIKEMTFETRAKLKVCSKSDRMMVHCIPLEFGDITLWSGEHEWSWKIKVQRPDKSVLFEAGPCGEYTMIVSFDGKSRLIYYESVDEAKEIVNQYALGIFDTIFRTTNVTIETFDSDFTFPNEYLDVINRPICTRMTIGGARSTDVTNYMNNFSTTDFTVEENFVDAELVDVETLDMLMNYDKLMMEIPNGINDDQLMRFEGRILYLGPSNVTSTGLNRFIKNIITADQYSTRENFSIHLKNDIWINEVIEGIQCKCYKTSWWDFCFEHEVAPGKCWYLAYDVDDSHFYIEKQIRK